MFHIVKKRCKRKDYTVDVIFILLLWNPKIKPGPFPIFVSFSFLFQQYNFVQEFRELYKAYLEEQKNMSKVAPQRSLSR